MSGTENRPVRRRSAPRAEGNRAATQANAEASREQPSSHQEPFHWAAILAHAAAAKNISKGARTLVRLKAGCARALEQIPYQTLRVADIVKNAGASHGLFYHYFDDKQQIALAVVSEFLAECERRYLNIRHTNDAYEAIYRANLYYLEVSRRNAGLMRAMLPLADELPSFRDSWNETMHRWHTRIAKSLVGHLDKKDLVVGSANLFAYALGGMIDQLCQQLYGQQNPHLGKLVKGTPHLAEVLTIIWFRAAYNRDPSTEQLNAARRPPGLGKARKPRR
jgi:AcrR family transcriptional regulator